MTFKQGQLKKPKGFTWEHTYRLLIEQGVEWNAIGDMTLFQGCVIMGATLGGY
jgi:hypothetical protein